VGTESGPGSLDEKNRNIHERGEGGTGREDPAEKKKHETVVEKTVFWLGRKIFAFSTEGRKGPLRYGQKGVVGEPKTKENCNRKGEPDLNWGESTRKTLATRGPEKLQS